VTNMRCGHCMTVMPAPVLLCVEGLSNTLPGPKLALDPVVDAERRQRAAGQSASVLPQGVRAMPGACLAVSFWLRALRLCASCLVPCTVQHGVRSA